MIQPHQSPRRTSFLSPGHASLLCCLGIVLSLTAYYLYIVIPFVALKADLLMFAETDFVASIIKLRNHLPLYTPPEDNNSLVYTPLTPLLTYWIASALGLASSIPAFRAIQVGFAGAAAVFGALSVWRLHDLRWPGRPRSFKTTFSFFAVCLLFLAATAPRVNPYSSSLHADALALLVTAFAFWNLLCYLQRPSRWRFVLLAACPALGFLTKQFLLIWAPIVCLVMLVEQPRNFRRVAGFALLSVGLFAAATATCYLLWGDAFMFWVFEVVGGPRRRIGISPDAYHISLVRSAKHLVTAWLEIAVGLCGVWAVARDTTNRTVVALAVGWLVLIAGETVTSGAGWNVLYHFGPGVLIGTVFFLAAVRGYWPGTEGSQDHWLRRVPANLVAIAAVVTALSALRVTPAGSADARSFPPRRPAPDLYRYIADIEREFEGVPIESVLIDSGSWVYLKHSFLMRDRAGSMADQPPIGIYRNIERFVDRIEHRTYSKILVRNFHGPFFLYDWHDWPRPSGVRDAILKNYQEVRQIPAVTGPSNLPVAFTGPVSVFEAKANGN